VNNDGGVVIDGQLWYSYWNGKSWVADIQVASNAGLTSLGMSESPCAILSPKPITVPARWMARLPDTSLLSQLTLPGTHESCTAGLVPQASAQDWSLLNQLNHGVRYVDIRCRHIQDTFAIHHDFVFTGLFFGEGVRDVCVNFLIANPTECIVMQIKHEYSDDNNTKTFQQVLDGYLQGFESFFYLDNHIPALGQVRGKIVVVRRFNTDSNAPRGLEPLTWQDNATFDVSYTAADGETVTFHIQDQYDVSIVPDTINGKWNAVQALLDRAKADASSAWYINFASGSSISGFGKPIDVAARINPQLWNYLGGAPFAHRLGTLMLDFPNDDMIRRIISLNTPI
jgi:1-phosphatidylinositol phosphodiesterase